MVFNKNILYLCLVLVPSLTRLDAQIIEESWAPISYNNELVYVELKNIESFQGDEIYVWTIENLKVPLEMEDIEEDIYRTKTYYLINKTLKRYSLLEIIYYDEENNVIKDYVYKSSGNDPELKYNYPIFPGTLIDLVLKRCLREIERKKE